MSRIPSLGLSLWLWVAPQALAAQARPILREPGLRAYVAEALERNAALAAAGTDVRAAAERIAPAGALPDPTLSFGLMQAPAPSFDLDREDMTMFPVRLEQMFPFPGKQGASAAVARREHAVAAADLGLTTHALAAEAAEAFFDLAYAHSALEVWAERLELADQAVKVTLARYETGAAPQAEALRAQVSRARIEEQGHGFKADVEAAAARADALRGGRGEAVGVPALVGPDSAALLAVLRDTLPDLAALRDRLAAGSPALTVAGVRVERARASVHVFDIAGRPDLMLMAEYAPRVSRDPFFTGMVGLSIPLWAARKQGPSAEAARHELSSTRRRYEDLQVRLESELRARLARLEAVRARIGELHEEVLPLAEAASASALASYSVGMVDLTMVLDAQDDLFQARLDLARLIAAYGAEGAALSALLGEEWYR